MALYGLVWLETSLALPIQQLCEESVDIDVKPNKGRGLRDQERNVGVLTGWCTSVWDSIYRARDLCPE